MRKSLLIGLLLSFCLVLLACNPLNGTSPAERLDYFLNLLRDQSPTDDPVLLDDPLEIEPDGWIEKSEIEALQTIQSLSRNLLKDGLRYQNHETESRLNEFLSCVTWKEETGPIEIQYPGNSQVETLCMLAFTLKVENIDETAVQVSIDYENHQERYRFNLTDKRKLQIDVETIQTIPDEEEESLYTHMHYSEEDIIYHLVQSDQNLNYSKLDVTSGDAITLTMINGVLQSTKWFLNQDNIIAEWIYNGSSTSQILHFYSEDTYVSSYFQYESENSNHIQLYYALAQLGNWNRLYLGSDPLQMRGLYSGTTFRVGNSGSVLDEISVHLYVLFDTSIFQLIVSHKTEELEDSMLDVSRYGLTFEHSQWNQNTIGLLSQKTSTPANTLPEYAHLVTLSQSNESSFSFGRVPF